MIAYKLMLFLLSCDFPIANACFFGFHLLITDWG
jgi:hypothetical protein